MSGSERPSETKAQVKARHQAELEEMGYVSWVNKWGKVAAGVSAIIGLMILIGSQVWPWLVQQGVKSELTILQQNTEAVEKLTTAVENTHNLLQATIEAAKEQGTEGDLRAQRLSSSIEALQNEVRLRHGVETGIVIPQPIIVGNASGFVGATGGGSGGGGSVASTPSRPRPRPARPMTRKQKLKAITQQVDQRLKATKSDPTADFREDVQAKLKSMPKKK